MRLSSVSAVLLAALFLTTACSTATVGGGSNGERSGISQSVTDHNIQLTLHDKLFKYNPTVMRKINQEVSQGHVLLTGIVQNPQYRIDVVKMAWETPGVTQVINEIKVENPSSFSSYSRDKWIGTQLRTKLLFDSDIASTNYNTDVVDGVIYIMGVALNNTELNKVMAIARSITYVRDVVSYVRTRDQITSDSGKLIPQDTTSQPSNYGKSMNNSMSRGTASSGSNAGYSNTSRMPASGGYDYQPETKRGGAVESSDLAPVR